MIRGTPSSLAQALLNGLSEAQEKFDLPLSLVPTDKLVESLRLHAKDFLAQKFQAAKFQAHQGRFSTENDLQILFDVCTKTSTCVNRG